MMEDNQFFAVVKEKMKDRGLNSTYTLLRLPGEYDLIMKQPRREGRLPMSDGMPDVLFSDEEVGVVALKNGDEILYTSLYWRANFAVNFLARVHYITPECDVSPRCSRTFDTRRADLPIPVPNGTIFISRRPVISIPK